MNPRKQLCSLKSSLKRTESANTTWFIIVKTGHFRPNFLQAGTVPAPKFESDGPDLQNSKLGGHAGPVFDAELIQISVVNKVSSFMFIFMMGSAFSRYRFLQTSR
jgi:hypothetical protein